LRYFLRGGFRGSVRVQLKTLIKKQTCRGKPAYILPGPKGHGGDEED
jgi:hypothetical protein